MTPPPGGGGGTPPPPGGGTTPVATQVQPLGLSPTYLIVSSAANVAQNLPGTTTAQFIVLDQTGVGMWNVTVNFAEAPGTSLLTLSAATAVTDSNGIATITVNSKNSVGTATLNATVAGIKNPATYSIPVIGAPNTITLKSVTPAQILGLAGSGIQENGVMSLVISDAFGTPVPFVPVSFTQGQPNLVTLAQTSTVAQVDGSVVAAYSAGKEVVSPR